MNKNFYIYYNCQAGTEDDPIKIEPGIGQDDDVISLSEDELKKGRCN